MTKQTGQRLTDSKLRNIAPKSKPITSSAVAGLVFSPSTTTKGTGTWILRYYEKLKNKRTKLTLGHYPHMGIAEAQEEAKLLRAALKQGLDPKVEKQKIKDQEQQKQANTFENNALQCIEHYKEMRRWKNNVGAMQMLKGLKRYVFPFIGAKPITEITIRDTVPLLVDIWNTKQPTADKIFQYMKDVFDWAIIMGYSHFNPMDVTRKALGKQKNFSEEEHRHPAINWLDIPQFFVEIFGQDENGEKRVSAKSKYVLMFIILTACRSGAARFIHWEDINMESKVWSLEPTRENSKAYSKKYYPLNPQVMKIISANRRRSGLVFPSIGGKAFSDCTLMMLLKQHAAHFKSDIPGRFITVHGFRTAFKAWSVKNGYDDRLSEIQLCHRYGTKVQRAYDRENMLEERREMMQAWIDYCLSKVTDFDSLL